MALVRLLKANVLVTTVNMAIDDIPRNKYGFPVKRKTLVAKFGGGGSVSGSDTKKEIADINASIDRKRAGIKDQPSKLDMAIDSVVDTIKRPFQSAPKVQGDPGSTVDQISSYNKRQADAINAADTTNEQTKRKGGQIKSKPRGVGLAQRGHGKAMKHGKR